MPNDSISSQFIELNRLYVLNGGEVENNSSSKIVKKHKMTINRAFIASFRASHQLHRRMESEGGSMDGNEHNSTIVVGNTEYYLADKYSHLRSKLGVSSF